MHIPDTIEEATSQLNGLGALLQATEWEKAAIVFAFTEALEHGDNQYTQGRDTTSLSFLQFAALGIIGLKSDQTVRKYHMAWQAAIDANQAAVVHPGTNYIVPTGDWEVAERSARASGASPTRVATMLAEKENVLEVINLMPVEDLFYLINMAQAKVDEGKTDYVDEDGPLDVMVASIDMTDALDKLGAAEPAWSRAVREGHITDDVAELHMSDLELVKELMKVAIASDSFEASVPR